MNNYNFYYMQRSGSHAIINWLANCMQTDGVGVLLKNASTMHSYVIGKITHFLNVHENIVPDKKVKINETILIIRDPFNWAASIRQCDLQKLGKIQCPRKNFPLGISITDTKIVQQTVDKYINMIGASNRYYTISFNKWFLGKAYREEICNHFKLEYNETSLNAVPFFGGGGSSFDGMEYDGKGGEMKVLDRWQIYQHDEVYLNFFKQHPILINISKDLFNFYPLQL